MIKLIYESITRSNRIIYENIKKNLKKIIYHVKL